MIEAKKKEAKAYAIQIQKSMVLYFTPDFEVLYMEIEAGKAAGVVPIQYVSYLPDASNGKVSGLSGR